MEKIERKPDGYWNNYDNCYNAAKECSTKEEFRKKYSRACNVSRENGWFKDYTWFIEIRKPKGYYTKDKCFELASECKTITEFQKKYSRAYQVSLKNGWIENFTWFERYSKPYGFWQNYDNCYNAAKQCKSRGEMCERFNQGYVRALEYGWIDDYTWFETQANYITDPVDNVYCYLWVKEKIAYVGRSVCPEMRDKEHRGIYFHCGKEDTMYKYCKKHNLEIPQMIIVAENVTLKEGLELEDYYKKVLKGLGFTMINKAKTGVGSGSTGAIGRDKYTKKHCEAVAKQCKTNLEFYKEHNGEWQKAYKKGWLKDYTWFEEIKKPNGYWKDYDNCYNAAKECKTSREFRIRFANAYAYSRKMGWHLDYTWFEDARVIRGTWQSYDKCKEEAGKYDTRGGFEKGSSSAYNAARENGWLDDFFGKNSKKSLGFWNVKSNCKEEAAKYKTRNEFKDKCGSGYNSALKNCWLDEFFPKAA